MEKIFENKVALITGGSFGIGRATALAFASRGAKVVVADYIEDAVTVEQIKANGGDAIFIKCDVSVSADVKNMIDKTIAKYGRLDYAFNNAGIEGQMGNTVDCTEENWDRTLNINLKGIWLCMKYEIPQMLLSGKGAIVNCSSVAGLIGFPGLPAYVSSKHAVAGLTKTTALEYAKSGIRVNAVSPGVIKTAMIDRLSGGTKEGEEQFTGFEPVGRMGQPEEIAEAVCFLCSDAASFMTGVIMPIDGGFVAQ
jgi:NAD(P)-dependent dehydrogenase (short-subunit alcohol dehydrogenase family)